MPKIRNFNLPPALTEELVLVAKEFPPDLVMEWGRAALPGGFTKAEMVRERMIARFRSDGALDPISLDMLSCEAPYRETVSALTLPALQNLLFPCCILAGPAAWILSLLLDPREEVFKWATELASKPIPTESATDSDYVIAEDAVHAFLSDTLLWPLGIDLAPPGPEEKPVLPPLDDFTKKLLEESGKQHQAQEKRIDQLTHELQQQKQRQQEKLKHLSDASEREKKSFYEQLRAIREHEQKLLKEKQELAARLDEAQKHAEALVAQRVQAETSAAVRKWLEQPRQTEAVVLEAEKSAKDLESRAEALLEAQARQDRHMGNRRELESRLGSLQSLRERISESLQNAVLPLAELKQLQTEVEAETARLRAALKQGKSTSEFAARLLAAVNTSGSWDDLRSLGQLLEQLSDASLLSSPEAREVYAALQRKFSLLAETQKARSEEPDTGWALREILFRNRQALLVLDGHNLLFNLTDLFEPYFEDGHPGRRARQRLVEVMTKLVQTRPNVQTKVCFDGPLGTAERVCPNLEVVYSGGTGANRADNLIVSYLQFKDLKSLDQKVFVVTDDREIRKQILQTGSKFVRNELFAVFLKDFGALS